MKSEQYINVIQKLNDEIFEADELVYSQGVFFDYSSNYYVDNINFMGISVFNSKCDSSVETEEELEHFIRNKVAKITDALCLWQVSNYKSR
jgi:hypothetical protein